MKGIEQQSYFYFLGNKSYEKMPVEVEEQCFCGRTECV